MIVGLDFFGATFGDTPVCTDMMDELQLNEGIYDEAYVNLDTTVKNTVDKPNAWSLTTIMDAKFTGDLDAGSINAEGFNVTKILLYRSLADISKWDVIGEFEYNPEFNLYDYVDRYVKNGASYKYAIVPLANEVEGDKLISDKIDVKYEGIFITDKNENRRLVYDINLGTITHNKQSAINQPIRGKYPIVTFGNSNYRTGDITVLPLSRETIALAGERIDKVAEQVNREEWIEFINNNKAKVLRMDNGVIMLIVTQNVNETPRDGGVFRDLVDINFGYVEIGELNHNNLVKHDLLPKAFLSKFTYDDFGGIISG